MTGESDAIRTSRERNGTEMYRDISPELLRVIEPVARDHGLEVVDVVRSGSGGRTRLQVILDTPEGDGRVLLDECAAVSREIGRTLDVEDPIGSSYVLEVTSPGVDRTLAREIDFERVLGQRVRVETREPLDGRRRFKGELVAFDGCEAHVRTESGAVRIPFAAIARANAVYPFESQARKR
jgi:ribosome maturation factor RimP